MKKKITVDELLERAKEEGMLEDFMRTDLITGKMTPFDRKLLEKWLECSPTE